MFCTNCGKEIPEGDRYCTHCGAPAVPPAKQEKEPVTPLPNPNTTPFYKPFWLMFFGG